MEVSTKNYTDCHSTAIPIIYKIYLIFFLLKQNILLCTIIRITINYITNVPTKNYFQTLLWRCWNDKTVHQFQLYIYVLILRNL